MDTKSYLMGVFDGEGSVNAYYQKNRWSLQVAVTMAAIQILEMFQETWGGNLHIRKRKTVGGLTLGQWYIGSSKAIPFLEYAAENGLWRRRRIECALELARNMAKYTALGGRRGVNIGQGVSFLSPEDHALRERLVLEMRSLSGARSRFDPNFERLPERAPEAPAPKPRPTRDQLVDLYVGRRMSIQAIATQVGCSRHVIRGELLRHQISVRTHAESVSLGRRTKGQGYTTT